MNNTEISLDKKYRTRNGSQVRILTVSSPDENYPVCGAVKTTGGWINKCWTKEGYTHLFGSEHHLDLIEIKKPESIRIFLNGAIIDVFADGSILINGFGFKCIRFFEVDFETIVKARETLLQQVKEYEEFSE